MQLCYLLFLLAFLIAGITTAQAEKCGNGSCQKGWRCGVNGRGYFCFHI
ncbi:unnamed protein product [Acanthoscelides obtectus]|uniref:Uncharacterized protein n=1 Tax=Acanthoscelides obtectus TaxID=200917 RepID=A0A9P0P2V2_ACAOB|nr:unnamed protein product [Acanthoscelides obtectus]CAK1683116.1 hypothetical protein AOBTE_LOCUS34090 [Acanthoscelides obtectus]